MGALKLYISLLHVLITQGTISVGVDATDLFDRYDEDFDELPGGGFPHIEINKMHISQSIEVRRHTRYINCSFVQSLTSGNIFLSSGSSDKQRHSNAVRFSVHAQWKRRGQH